MSQQLLSKIQPTYSRDANVRMIRDMAERLQVPIQVIGDVTDFASVRYNVRHSNDPQAKEIHVMNARFQTNKYQLCENMNLVKIITKYGKSKLLLQNPFAEINTRLPLQCEDFIIRYVAADGNLFSVRVDTLTPENFNIPKPKVVDQKFEAIVTCLIKPAPGVVPPVPPTPQQLMNEARDRKADEQRNLIREQEKNDTEVFKEILTDNAYTSHRIPFEDRRRELRDLVTNFDDDGVALVSSLNLFTTKIVRDKTGNIHVFQPMIQKGHHNTVAQMVESPRGEAVKWVRTKVIKSTILQMDDEQMKQVEKISENRGPKRKPAQLKKAPSIDGSDSGSDSDDDPDYCKRTEAYSDSDNDNDTEIHPGKEDAISKFYSRPDKYCHDYGSESVYKDAISTYKLNWPEWKSETIEYIKLLPMHDAYNMFCTSSTTFPCEKHMIKEIIQLMRRSGAFYKLFSEEELADFTDEERAHIYIAQLATDASQKNAIAINDHVALANMAVRNYKKFWPNAKTSTLERIKQLPYDRLVQIFFQNQFPSRSLTIHYIKLLMDSEDISNDHVNYLFRIPNYLEKLPTETLHRIFFIKLTYEGQYKIHLLSVDVFHPGVLEVNRAAKTPTLTALKSSKPLQSIRPRVEDGDEIPEPAEQIQVESPIVFRQHNVDSKRRQMYLEALGNDVDLANATGEQNFLMRQHIIYSKKWPNYNTTLNYFKPAGTQNFDPCIINQLDCLPMPFAIPSVMDEHEYVDQQTVNQKLPTALASNDYDDDEIDVTILESNEIPTTSTTINRKRQYSTSNDEEQADSKRISEDYDHIKNILEEDK